MSSPTTQPAPFACAWWPWRLAVASYICLLLTIVLSLTHAYGAFLHPLNLAFSACCLLGLTLLVAAAMTAIFSLQRPNAIDFLVLLVTLPPLGLHIWSVFWGA